MVDDIKAKRIPSTVNDNLRNAIAIYAVYEKGTSDAALISKFNNSYAANAFNVLRYSLFYMVIASLTRVWDDAQDALSIPQLRTHLSEPKTQAAILDHRHQAMLGLESHPAMVRKYGGEPAVIAALQKISRKDAERAATEAQGEIARCLDLIEKANADPVMATLRNFRHKVIAHSLEITRAEKAALVKGQRIESLKYGDEAKILRNTIPIVVSLNLLLDELNIFFEDFEKIWRRYSDEFWERLK